MYKCGYESIENGIIFYLENLVDWKKEGGYSNILFNHLDFPDLKCSSFIWTLNFSKNVKIKMIMSV